MDDVLIYIYLGKEKKRSISLMEVGVNIIVLKAFYSQGKCSIFVIDNIEGPRYVQIYAIHTNLHT